MQLEKIIKKIIGFRTFQGNHKDMRACFDFCADLFKGCSVFIKRYECMGNLSMVIQTVDSTDVDVLFLGHIDTIDGNDELFQGVIKDGKIFGRGTLDMKAFVVTSLISMRELLDEGCRTSMAVAITADEETGGACGAGYLANTVGYTARVVLNPDDGEQINSIVVESKHIMHLRFKAQGVEAHGSAPWLGVNAIEVLFQTYQSLRCYFPMDTDRAPGLWVNTINLGKIEGGVAANEVPKEASMVVDIRLTKETTREQALDWVEKSLFPGVTYEITMEGNPVRIRTGDIYIKNYTRAIEKITGDEAIFTRSGGGTDGRYFAHKGVPVIIHQGNGGDAQSEKEHVEIASLRKLIDIQKEFIKSSFLS